MPQRAGVSTVTIVLLMLASHGDTQAPAGPPQIHGLYWVLAIPPAPGSSTVGGGLETHLMACNRMGLVPTARVAVFADGAVWNQSTADAIAAALDLPAPSLAGCCASSMWCTANNCSTHHWGTNAYTNYGFYRPSHQPLYTCNFPAYEDLHTCTQDYTQLCPQHWTGLANGFVCTAPANYSGPCSATSVLGMYNAAAKANWGLQCVVTWPLLCTPTFVPEVASVNVWSATPALAGFHVEGFGFGDDANNIAAFIGDHECTDIEVCHTVCRSCSTDADCGAGAL